jgi:RNA polymerase sigma-70 factor (ECF subfamily)
MDSLRRGQTRGVTLRLAQSASDEVADVGRPPRFPELFEQHAPYVWTTLRRLGAQARELDDLTHEVFIQIFRHLEQYDPRRPIRPWLFGFVLRIASEHRRRGPHRVEVLGEPEVVDATPSPVERLLAEERRQLAWAALAELELKRRAVFILHEIDGYPIPEVADALGVPLATAYSQLRLARQDFSKAAQRLRSRQR